MDQQIGVSPVVVDASVPRVRTPEVVTSATAAGQQSVALARKEKLDQRLAAVLRGFVEGFACDAADFFVLNTASTELAVRASYRAGEGEDGAERRSLANARADVAAMAGSAIVLEDDIEVAGWDVPMWCGAAVCLPVASDETIHGTLWLYSREPRAFADAELQLAEVIAGRLAVELEVEAWRSEAVRCDDPAPCPADSYDESPAMATWSAAAPNIRVARRAVAPQLEDWELAGWTVEAAAMSFFDWQTLADGRTLVAAGALAEGSAPIDGWLQAARVALRAHAPAAQDAGELLTHANRTLWLASPGGEGLAVAVALLDGDGARTSVAAAGDAGFARWRAAQCKWNAPSCPPLGWSERAVYAQWVDELMVRERLLLVATPDGVPSERCTRRLAERLRRTAPEDMRRMPGKRALRVFKDAATCAGFSPSGLAMVRRR